MAVRTVEGWWEGAISTSAVKSKRTPAAAAIRRNAKINSFDARSVRFLLDFREDLSYSNIVVEYLAVLLALTEWILQGLYY